MLSVTFRNTMLHTHQAHREPILRIMQAALRAVDPYTAVLQYLRQATGGQDTREQAPPLVAGRVIVVGAGKAGGRMVVAAEEALGERIAGGAVVVKYGHTMPTRRVPLYEAGHPVPDEAGVQGTAAVLRCLRNLSPADRVLCLLSGGASALLVQPAAGITLRDLQVTNDLLLRSGAPIQEINAVRKHLSGVKGGNLARYATPAPLVSLILSDVVGNRLDVIASGPTVPDQSTYADAIAVLQRRDLQDRVPGSVRAHLEQGLRGEIPETPKPGDPLFHRCQAIITGSNEVAARAALAQAETAGFHTLLLSTFVEGEAREVAKVLGALVREIRHSGEPVSPPACIVVGGETTVTVRGKGKGGRNQELALAAAIQIAGLEGVVIASLATDGTDGPTDAAGALADGTTIARGTIQGLDAYAHLANNDAYSYFEALGDLLFTGPTGTNVNDLIFLVVYP